MNSLLKKEMGNEYSIDLVAQQFPNSPEFPDSSDVTEATGKTFFFMLFYFPAVALFVVHPLKETLTKIKQLQMMTAKVSYFTYWGTMFAVDFMIAMASSVLIVLGFACLNSAADLELYNGLESSKQFFINVKKYIFLEA